jgi:hypothetical protein
MREDRIGLQVTGPGGGRCYSGYMALHAQPDKWLRNWQNWLLNLFTYYFFVLLTFALPFPSILVAKTAIISLHALFLNVSPQDVN